MNMRSPFLLATILHFSGVVPWAVEFSNRMVTHGFSNGNLVRNGSFEINQADWRPDLGGEYAILQGWDWSNLKFNGAAQVKAQSGFKHASYDLDVTSAFRGLKSDFFPIKPGNTYSVGYYYRAGGVVGTVQGAILCYQDKNGQIGESIIPIPTTYADRNAWTKIEHAFKVPSNAQFGRIALIQVPASGAHGTFLFDDVLLEPGTASHQEFTKKELSFFDGLNRPIQTVVPDKDKDRVAQNFYDAAGRLEKASLSLSDDFLATNERHDFVPGITAASDAGADLLDLYYVGAFKNGTYYPNSSGISFHQTAYESSELSRAKEMSLPGAAWYLGSANTVQLSYSSAPNLNGGGQPDPYDPNAPSLYGYEYQKAVNGEKTWSFMDGFGRPVKTGILKADGGKVETEFEYDGLDNVTKVKPPADANGFRLVTEKDYNTLSQLTADKTQQAGLAAFIYDQTGNLRFSQDAVQKAANRLAFIQYDQENRVLVTGEITYPPSNNQFTQANADNRDYPGKFSHASENGIDYKIRTVNHYDTPPANTNSCQVENTVEDLLLLVSPDGYQDEIFSPTIVAAYAKGSVFLGARSSFPGEVAIYQVYKAGFDAFEPAAGSEFEHMLLQDGSYRGFEIIGLKEGSAEYASILSRAKAGSIHWGALKGRLTKTRTFNFELASTGSLPEQEVSTVYNYDNSGNVVDKFEYNGYVEESGKRCVLTHQKYDALDRPISKIVCVGLDCDGAISSENYAYDHLGRLAKVSDDFGSTLMENEYDGLGNLHSQSMGGALASNAATTLKADFFQHLHGQLERYKVKEAQTGNLVYQEDLRYEKPKTAAELGSWGDVGPVDEPAFESDQARYDSKIARVTYRFKTDLQGQLMYGTTQGFDYKYDMLSRLTNENGFGSNHSPIAALTSVFTYRNDGRLATATRGSGFGQYAYDDATLAGTGRLLGVNGNLVFERNLGSAFTYLANGNLANDLSKNALSEDFAHYRGDNLPYKFRYGVPVAAKQTNMLYNSSGDRVSKISYAGSSPDHSQHYYPGGVELRWDRSGTTEEIFEMGGFGRIIYDPNAGNYEKEFYLRNSLGSTMLVYNADKHAVTHATTYFAYGKEADDVNTSDAILGVTPKFSKKELDDETSLNYFGARYYDADIGMWTTPDAVRQNPDLYAYASNDPINRVDPDGNEDEEFDEPLNYNQVFPAMAEYPKALLKFSLSVSSNLIDQTPIAGDVKTGIEVATDLHNGNYADAGGGAVAMAVGVIPGGDVAKSVVKRTVKRGAEHASSLLSTKRTELYVLLQRGTNKILKFGETTRGLKRYSKKYLQEMDAKMRFLKEGVKREMREVETRMIRTYKKLNNGKRPPLNKSDH